MHHFRTKPRHIRALLEPVAFALEPCWWCIGSAEFAPFCSDYEERVRQPGWSAETHCNQFEQLVARWVIQTNRGQIGVPGFFSQLLDAVAFDWSVLVAVESDSRPEIDHEQLKKTWMDDFFKGIRPAPQDPRIVLTVMEIDNVYRVYSFRDEWMFKIVIDNAHGKSIWLLEDPPSS